MCRQGARSGATSESVALSRCKIKGLQAWDKFCCVGAIIALTLLCGSVTAMFLLLPMFLSKKSEVSAVSSMRKECSGLSKFGVYPEDT